MVVARRSASAAERPSGQGPRGGQSGQACRSIVTSACTDHEHLMGIEMWAHEVRTERQEKAVSVTALVAKLDGFDSVKEAIRGGQPLNVRKIELEMQLDEFFGFFNRFAISISPDGLLDRKKIQFQR